MPARAPRICGHCGGVHQAGERCPKASALKRERGARADRNRPTAKARGYDADWQKLRANFLTVYPSCRRCGAAATLVDHIISVRKAPHRRLDPSNLQSLCTSCHSGAKQSEERRPSERTKP